LVAINRPGVWAFDLHEAARRYGDADETIPVSAGRWLTERLSRSRLTVWPDHGHLTWANSIEAAQVVEAMIAPGTR
jgi:pimeloyl-ACP methyl ester carboxylesterase